MDTKELYDLAQAANTCANVAITLGPKCVTVVWHGDRSVHGTTNPNWYGSRHTRELPWSALGDDRDPYRAVREYMKMDAFYMEGIGGIPDRTHPMFGTTAPAFKPARGPRLPPLHNAQVAYVRMGIPVLSVTPADLFPGDIVEMPESPTGKEVVKGVSIRGCDYEVCWVSGERTLFSHNRALRIIRRSM